MTPSAWAYLAFTAGLAATFAGIVAYYFRGSRRDRTEAPKYRMLEDDRKPVDNGTRPEGGR